MMKRKDRILMVLASLVLAMGLASLSSCEQYVWTPPEPPVINEDIIISFEQHILPKCSGCHTTWSDSKIYNELSSNVDTVNPDNSEILDIHSSVNNFNTLIQVNDTLELYFVDVIKTWASQGAKDNK
jgi:hypothetical protein